MKVLRFKKVASSVNDANIEYFVPAKDIMSLYTTDSDTLYVYLRAVDGVANNETGDRLTIDCASGKAVIVGDAIASLIYGNKSLGTAPLIDTNFGSGYITDLILETVS
jgi:hypothetical protein